MVPGVSAVLCDRRGISTASGLPVLTLARHPYFPEPAGEGPPDSCKAQ